MGKRLTRRGGGANSPRQRRSAGSSGDRGPAEGRGYSAVRSRMGFPSTRNTTSSAILVARSAIRSMFWDTRSISQRPGRNWPPGASSSHVCFHQEFRLLQGGAGGFVHPGPRSGRGPSRGQLGDPGPRRRSRQVGPAPQSAPPGGPIPSISAYLGEGWARGGDYSHHPLVAFWRLFHPAMVPHPLPDLVWRSPLSVPPPRRSEIPPPWAPLLRAQQAPHHPALVHPPAPGCPPAWSPFPRTSFRPLPPFRFQ